MSAEIKANPYPVAAHKLSRLYSSSKQLHVLPYCYCRPLTRWRNTFNQPLPHLLLQHPPAYVRASGGLFVRTGSDCLDVFSELAESLVLEVSPSIDLHESYPQFVTYQPAYETTPTLVAWHQIRARRLVTADLSATNDSYRQLSAEISKLDPVITGEVRMCVELDFTPLSPSSSASKRRALLQTILSTMHQVMTQTGANADLCDRVLVLALVHGSGDVAEEDEVSEDDDDDDDDEAASKLTRFRAVWTKTRYTVEECVWLVEMCLDKLFLSDPQEDWKRIFNMHMYYDTKGIPMVGTAVDWFKYCESCQTSFSAVPGTPVISICDRKNEQVRELLEITATERRKVENNTSLFATSASSSSSSSGSSDTTAAAAAGSKTPLPLANLTGHRCEKVSCSGLILPSFPAVAESHRWMPWSHWINSTASWDRTSAAKFAKTVTMETSPEEKSSGRWWSSDTDMRERMAQATLAWFTLIELTSVRLPNVPEHTPFTLVDGTNTITRLRFLPHHWKVQAGLFCQIVCNWNMILTEQAKGMREMIVQRLWSEKHRFELQDLVDMNFTLAECKHTHDLKELDLDARVPNLPGEVSRQLKSTLNAWFKFKCPVTVYNTLLVESVIMTQNGFFRIDVRGPAKHFCGIHDPLYTKPHTSASIFFYIVRTDNGVVLYQLCSSARCSFGHHPKSTEQQQLQLQQQQQQQQEQENEKAGEPTSLKEYQEPSFHAFNASLSLSQNTLHKTATTTMTTTTAASTTPNSARKKARGSANKKRNAGSSSSGKIILTMRGCKIPIHSHTTTHLLNPAMASVNANISEPVAKIIRDWKTRFPNLPFFKHPPAPAYKRAMLKIKSQSVGIASSTSTQKPVTKSRSSNDFLTSELSMPGFFASEMRKPSDVAMAFSFLRPVTPTAPPQQPQPMQDSDELKDTQPLTFDDLPSPSPAPQKDEKTGQKILSRTPRLLLIKQNGVLLETISMRESALDPFANFDPQDGFWFSSWGGSPPSRHETKNWPRVRAPQALVCFG